MTVDQEAESQNVTPEGEAAEALSSDQTGAVRIIAPMPEARTMSRALPTTLPTLLVLVGISWNTTHLVTETAVCLQRFGVADLVADLDPRLRS